MGAMLSYSKACFGVPKHGTPVAMKRDHRFLKWVTLGGLPLTRNQAVEDVFKTPGFDTAEEVHLHGQSGEHLLFRYQAHVAGHFAELLPIKTPIKGIQHTLNVSCTEHFQIDEYFTQLFPAAHDPFVPGLA
jgi:hypothetical protein